MKKFFTTILILLIIVAVAAMYLFFTSATGFNTRAKYVYVNAGGDIKKQVLLQLDTGDIIKSPKIFELAADRLDIWKNITPGKFEIKKDESLSTILNIFKNNRQLKVTINIGRVRTKQGIARLLAKNFSVDSTNVVTLLNDSVYLQKFGVDTNTLFTLIIPQSYTFKWYTSLDTILNRFKASADSFWQQGNRVQKAADMGFTRLQATIFASIVEEETSKDDEKGNIASVYINRYKKNMALAADPTIKYALRDFSLQRIYFGHLGVNSPYNTYRNKGLPPGPICTPTRATIDAVLNAPATGYLFFVAKSDFSGYHHFSATFEEHQQYAKQYQAALDTLQQKKQEENQ